MTLVLARYDAAAIRARLAAAGVLDALAARGFAPVEVAIETVAGTVPHVRVYGTKSGARHLLLDAILLETVATPPATAFDEREPARPMRLLVVQWLREEDPTAAFSADRPPLPVQRHPGLGILRRAFTAVVAIARELGEDGVASVPKLFHDAAIFYRSRLFLFLDPREQGRFEALTRDLAGLPLGDASLAIIGGCVRDAGERVVRWEPGLLVLPLSPAFVAYFHGKQYTAGVERAAAGCTFRCDLEALARTHAMLAGREDAIAAAAP
jgi:hypothetical protein